MLKAMTSMVGQEVLGDRVVLRMSYTGDVLRGNAPPMPPPPAEASSFALFVQGSI